MDSFLRAHLKYLKNGSACYLIVVMRKNSHRRQVLCKALIFCGTLEKNVDSVVCYIIISV